MTFLKATTPKLKEIALERARRSMLRCIELAKQGKQTAGAPVWGREYDQETGEWTIDPEKQAVMCEIADRYLGGESLESLSREYGFARATLHYIIFKRCGPDLQIEFNSDKLDIHESVTIKLPPLLPAETIERLHARKQAWQERKPRQRSQRKLDKSFALTSYLFCAHCGAPFYGNGQENLRHYFHKRAKRFKPCKTKAPQCAIRARWLEDAVFLEILRALPRNGNLPEDIVRAIVTNCVAHLEWEDQRYLLKKALGENRRHQEKHGVFIRWTDSNRLGWEYEIRGLPKEALSNR